MVVAFKADSRGTMPTVFSNTIMALPGHKCLHMRFWCEAMTQSVVQRLCCCYSCLKDIQEARVLFDCHDFNC